MKTRSRREDDSAPIQPNRLKVGMPSLEEVARRLGSLPLPKAFTLEEYSFFQSLWALYPDYADQWSQVISPRPFGRDVSSRLSRRKPLLGSEDIRFEALPILRLWKALSRLFEQQEEANKDQWDDFRSIRLLHGTDPASLTRAFFNSRADGYDPRILIGGCLLRPFLYMAARKAFSMIHQEDWKEGVCPFCAGEAYHAMIEMGTNRRILACSKCHFLWTFPRIQCPYCGNRDQNLLGFHYDEDDPVGRIDFCLLCNRTLATTIQKEEDAYPLLMYDHLVTSDLQRTIERRRPWTLPEGAS